VRQAISILGAGKIGGMIAELLVVTGDYRVRVLDRRPEALQTLARAIPGLETRILEGDDEQALASALGGEFALLNAAPFELAWPAARAAVTAGAHYLDLTEDVASARAVADLAGLSTCALIPQCGLAPGFISIVTQHLVSRFDRLLDVKMRVGALPRYPTNALQYNLTWSTDGLINEYLNPCQAIINGSLVELTPLGDLDRFSLDGVNYEAFNTSGGLGTLCESLAGKVRNLDYRTVRYPGHRDMMRMLLKDLRLAENRPLLKQILENALPVTLQDVVLILVSVSGEREGRLMQETIVRKIYGREINGRQCSAIQITTASGICAVLDLLAQGRLPRRGFLRQESIAYDDFINNRFGAGFSGDVEAMIEDAVWGGVR